MKKHKLIPIILWSIAIEMIYLAAFMLSQFSPKIKSLLKTRGLASLRNSAKHKTHNASTVSENNLLFFCSSAGEYEQTLPIIREFEKESYICIIVFFSQSGYNFAITRQESRQFFISPVDSYWRWSLIFQYFNVQSAFVTRHEIWPAFIAHGNKTKFGVFLVNASSPHESSTAKVLVQKLLLNYFKKIFIVENEDRPYFEETLAVDSQKVSVIGDSKYDSVFQRVASNRKHAETLLKQLDLVAPSTHRLIVGSAWPLDVKICLETLSEMKKDSDLSCQLLIAMHEPNTASHFSIEEECKKRNFRLLYHSNLNSGLGLRTDFTDVIIVDSMGLLSDLYACAQSAFVGGAMHHKVHNVLEPAFYGLAIAFGPLYNNSREAVKLVEQNLASPCDGPKNLAKWWLEQIRDNYAKTERTQAYLSKHLGVSQAIVHNLLDEKTLS